MDQNGIEKNVKVWLSTDGKMTIEFGSETPKEAELLFDSCKPLFQKMVALMKENDLKPQKGGFPPKKERNWIERACPKDGGRLYREKFRSGKEAIKCENSKYNPVTKQAFGCDFIEWVDNTDLNSQFPDRI